MLKDIYKKIYSPDIQVLAGPLVLLVLFGFLTIVLVKNGYSQITTQLDNLKKASQAEERLESKLSTLKRINTSFDGSSSDILVALPEDNPGIQLIAQLKQYAADNTIPLNKIEMKGLADVSDTLTKIQIISEFELVDYNSAISFLRSFQLSSPISSLDSFKVETIEGGILIAEAEISVYWSKLPTELPPLTEPVKEFTSEELALLGEVSSLLQPQFTIIPPSVPSQRENLFN